LHDGASGVLIALNKRDRPFDEMDQRILSFADDYVALMSEKIKVAASLDRVLEEKSTFVSVIAHELKVPMTSIKGYAELLSLGTVGEMSDTQKQFLGTITRNVNRMDRLVAALLDLSRLEMGKITPDLQLVGVKLAVNDAVRNAEEIAGAKNLTLKAQVSPDLPLIYADPARLGQILDDLLGNAALYTPERGSVIVSVRFPASDRLLSPNQRERFVEIEICDTGIGIAEEDRPKVFHQFFRGDHPLVQEAAGTGFSLMVVRGLVELQGGKIGFESQLGQGSRFFMAIPVASADR
jgi:signal transduction histidine kinase